MVDQELIEKLKHTLKELFQFEKTDLDFGMYRIINIKRKEISDFIENELIDIIRYEISTIKKNQQLKNELEEFQKDIENKFSCNIIDAIKDYDENPKIKDYLNKQKRFEKHKVEFEEEIYNNIINFFSRYYDNGDYISKRRYSRNNKYMIPYNGEEVYLYWANNDQYYIKTTQNFKNYSFRVGKWKINFQITDEDNDLNIKNTEKKYLIFSDLKSTSADTVTIYFGYRGLTSEEENVVKKIVGKKTITKDYVNKYNLKLIEEKLEISAIKELKEKHSKITGELSDLSELEWHLNKYTIKNTADYFIHKNLKSFLTQELDFYIKNEIFEIDKINTVKEIKLDLQKIKAFKATALTIIEFLAQIEEFQKKLWEKKKFIVETNYLITLDLIDRIHYPRILQNSNQLREWKKLFNFDMNKMKNGNTLFKFIDNNETKNILENYPSLVLDTKFFENDFKYELLSNFQNLEEETTGILIKSDNYHQLDLFLQKYEEKISCIYLDPPYNTQKDGFIYKDGYMDSSWLSFMRDRLEKAPLYLKKDGVIFVSIDYHEFHNLKILMEDIFGKKNHLSDLVWYLGTGTTAGQFVRYHENIIVYAKNKKLLENFDNPVSGETIKHGALKKISRANPASVIEFPAGMEYEGKNAIFRREIGGSEKMFIISDKMEFENGKLKFPTKIKAGWGFRDQILNWISGKETIDTKGQKVKRFYFKSSGILAYEKEKSKINPKSVLEGFGSTQNGTDVLIDLFGKCEINFPKPPNLIQFLTSLSTGEGGFIFDYFSGSGTTGHAVISQNKKDGKKRKFILVEMGNHFDNILKPRIEKVIFSEYNDENKNWKNGKPLKINGSVSQIIKYQILEQYEDSLNNINFKIPNSLALNSKDYKIKYMLDFETKESNIFLNLDFLDNPFEYKLNIDINNKIKYVNVDLIETFNYLAGIFVHSTFKKKDNTVDYIIVKGRRNKNKVIVIWRNKNESFDPERDKEFVEKEIIAKEEYDEIFINGNSLIENSTPLDVIFKKTMFGE